MMIAPILIMMKVMTLRGCPMSIYCTIRDGQPLIYDDDDTDTDYADDGDDPDLALQEVLIGRLQTGRDSQQLATSPFNSG